RRRPHGGGDRRAWWGARPGDEAVGGAGVASSTVPEGAAPFTGTNGSTSSHNSSETIHGVAAIDTPSSLTTDADCVGRQQRVPAYEGEGVSVVGCEQTYWPV